MREVPAIEAETMLGALLDEVEGGQEVVITRGGKPVARLVATAAVVDRSDAEAAAQRIIANRSGKTLGGLKLKDLIDEGRP